VTQVQEESALLARLLDEHIWGLRNAIRAADLLSKPVEPGRWRWADVKFGGYARKTADEMAEDQARETVKAARLRDELAVAVAARARIGTP
jgi:hypothetical protein